MLAGEGELDPGLDEIVADRNLAAERVATACRRKLIQVVGIPLDEHGHVKVGEFERIRHALLIAEVRQAYEDAVNVIGVPLEQRGTLTCVGVGFNPAELGFVFTKLDGFEAELREERRHLRPGFGDELVGEKVAVAVDDGKRRRHRL